jgi:hypothetical protein
MVTNFRGRCDVAQLIYLECQAHQVRIASTDPGGILERQVSSFRKRGLRGRDDRFRSYRGGKLRGE